MAKPTRFAPEHSSTVRTRRAYFDCRFGQLHVRTAFPTSGGFDEGTTLLCLHPGGTSSRTFDRFLPEIGVDRSVYAPDLPGCGESDAAPTDQVADAAAAVADFARDLRLRQVDVLGFRFGAAVALALAASKPDLVRRLVLVAAPPMDAVPLIQHPSLVMHIKQAPGEEAQWARSTLARARFVDLADHAGDLFDAAPKTLARQIGDFLTG